MTSISNLSLLSFVHQCKKYNNDHPNVKITHIDIDRASRTAFKIYQDKRKAEQPQFSLGNEGFSQVNQDNKEPYWKEIYSTAELLGILAGNKEVKLLVDFNSVPKLLENKESHFRIALAALKVAGYTLSQNNDEKMRILEPNPTTFLPPVDKFKKQLLEVTNEELTEFIALQPKIKNGAPQKTPPPRPSRKDLPKPPIPSPKKNEPETTNQKKQEKEPESTSPKLSFSTIIGKVKKAKSAPTPISEPTIVPSKSNSFPLSNKQLPRENFIEEVKNNWMKRDEKKLKEAQTELTVLESNKKKIEKQLEKAPQNEKSDLETKIYAVTDSIKDVNTRIETLIKPTYIIDDLSNLGTTPEEVGQLLFETYQEGINSKENPFYFDNAQLAEEAYSLKRQEAIEKFLSSDKEFSEFFKENPEYLYIRLAYLLGLIHSGKEICIPCEKGTIDFRSLCNSTKKGSSIGRMNITLTPLGYIISGLKKSGYICSDSKEIFVPEKNKKVLTRAFIPGKKTEKLTLFELKKENPFSKITELKNYINP